MKKSPGHHFVLIGNFLHYAVREFYEGLGAYVAERNLFSLDFCHVIDSNDLKSKSPLLRQADSYFIANIIPNNETGSIETKMRRVIRKIKPGGMPCVFCLSDVKLLNLPSISINQLQVGEMAANHLHHRGYRHFAFFGPSAPMWSTIRKRGFERRLKELGFTCKLHEFSSDQTFFQPLNPKRRFEAQLELLSSLPRPCGVFAASDHIASVLIQAARHHGIRIPDQLGVLGVDNEPFHHAAAGMPISSIEIPFREHGYRAAEIADKTRKGQKVPRNTQLSPVRVVVRASTDLFMVNDPLVRRAQAYIETHRNGPVRVGDLLKALPTTKATLNKHFSQTLDTTPSEYILRRRLEYAAELLRSGERSVEAVAENCGFSSRHYFGLTFKNMMGFTPGSLLFQRRRTHP